MRKKNITHPRQSSFKLSQSNKSMRGIGSTETNNQDEAILESLSTKIGSEKR